MDIWRTRLVSLANGIERYCINHVGEQHFLALRMCQGEQATCGWIMICSTLQLKEGSSLTRCHKGCWAMRREPIPSIDVSLRFQTASFLVTQCPTDLICAGPDLVFPNWHQTSMRRAICDQRLRKWNGHGCLCGVKPWSSWLGWTWRDSLYANSLEFGICLPDCQTENGECCACTLQSQHLNQIYQNNMSMDRLAKAGSERLKAGKGCDGRFALEVAFVFAMCVCVCVCVCVCDVHVFLFSWRTICLTFSTGAGLESLTTCLFHVLQLRFWETRCLSPTCLWCFFASPVYENYVVFLFCGVFRSIC